MDMKRYVLLHVILRCYFYRYIMEDDIIEVMTNFMDASMKSLPEVEVHYFEQISGDFRYFSLFKCPWRTFIRHKTNWWTKCVVLTSNNKIVKTARASMVVVPSMLIESYWYSSILFTDSLFIRSVSIRDFFCFGVA